MLYIQRAAATESKPLNLVVALSIYNLGKLQSYRQMESWLTTSENGTVSHRGIQPKRRKQHQEIVESPSSAAHHNDVK